MFALGLAVVLAVGAGPRPAAGEDEPPTGVPQPLRVAVPEHWPPSFSLGRGGVPTGFAVDVWKALSARLSLETKWVVRPTYADVVGALAAGSVDVVPEMGITEERQPLMCFTRPIQVQVVRIFVRVATSDIRGVEDLAGKRVAVVDSNVGVSLMRARPDVLSEPFEHPRLALLELLSGGVDALVYPEPPLRKLARDIELEEHLKVVGPPLAEIKRAIALRHGLEDLALRLDAAIGSFVETEDYQRIYAHWFGQEPEFWTTTRVLVHAGALLLLLFLLMAVWRYRAVVSLNRRLVSAHEQRARTEQRLRQREAELHHAQKLEAVGRLAGGVAHDFNNLLMAIRGYGELLLGRLQPDDARRREVQEILSAAERATHLTGKLLAFSRRQPLLPTVFDLGDVVRGTERMLRPLIGEDVELVTRIPMEPTPVFADRAQIEQVLMNLTVNARDAMPEGGRLEMRVLTRELTAAEPSVRGALQAGTWAALEVEDTGHGIPADILSRIFEPFFTTKAPTKGTGLGLSTAYGIVEQSEGDLQVESQPGRGTCFRVLLPRAMSTVTAKADPIVVTPDARGSETVLVAEDNAQVRALIAHVFEELGYRVHQAEDGASGLEAAERLGTDALDILVTDLVMPRMGGLELVRRLRQKRPDLKVVLVSGYAEQIPSAEDLADGRTAFLKKPCSPEAIAQAVRTLLALAAVSRTEPPRIDAI